MSGDETSDEGGQGFVSQVVASVPDSWRAKIRKSILQLLVGTEKGAAMYSEGRRRLDHMDSRSLVEKRLAEVVAEQMANDPHIVERYKARLLNDLLEGQQNLEAVISGAVHHLPALPPPDAATPSQDAAAGDAEWQEAPIEEAAPLDTDWAAAFTAYAEKASSEGLRDRLSRILAGEITRPGAFPRAAVRALVELEQSDLQAMQVVLPFVLRDAIYPQEAPEKRPTIDELLPLVDAGLVMDPAANLHRFWGAEPNHPTDVTSLVEGAEYVLAVTVRPGGLMKHDMIPLTRAGQAVVKLLGRPDERPILRQIAAQAQKIEVKTIKLGRAVGPQTVRVEEHLYPPIDYSGDVSAGV